MSKYVKRWLLGLVLLAPAMDLYAQGGIGYTQYMDNLSPLNSAYSLLEKNGVVNVNARRQYVGLDGAPTAIYFNASAPLPTIGASAGLLLISDQFAIEQNIEVAAFFAKGIQLSETQNLAVSLNAGLKRYVANYTSLDAGDPSFMNDIRETAPTFGFGILYYAERFFVGVSMPKFSIRRLGDASAENRLDLKNRYYLTGGYLLPLTEELSLKPTAIGMFADGMSSLGNVSATLYIKEFLGLGAGLSTNGEASGLLSINANTFRIGYSYQVVTSSTSLNGMSNATHEVSLGFRFGKNPKAKLL